MRLFWCRGIGKMTRMNFNNRRSHFNGSIDLNRVGVDKQGGPDAGICQPCTSFFYSVSLTRDGLLRVDEMIPEFYLSEHRGTRYA